MGDAIGMVETKGMVPLVHATDAMLKTANVSVQGWRKVGADLHGVRRGRRWRGPGGGGCGAVAARAVGEVKSCACDSAAPRRRADVLPK